MSILVAEGRYIYFFFYVTNPGYLLHKWSQYIRNHDSLPYISPLDYIFFKRDILLTLHLVIT